MATVLYEDLNPKSEYIDKSLKLSDEEYFKKLKTSSTIYVGSPRSQLNHLKFVIRKLIYLYKRRINL